MFDAIAVARDNGPVTTADDITSITQDGRPPVAIAPDAASIRLSVAPMMERAESYLLSVSYKASCAI
ncbi:hypothetical protein [Luteimonas kalidii]|uniref:Uncharacterized protein n=1 Tax=Luteimonas kalidii TaxID=3042025 RepID=A0ABT6JX82_9GAMM|nr:hypothetical protein [Luteimonas kalidii]MDH5835313.1 hypothetical protein [Luteimonas kalidii]